MLCSRLSYPKRKGHRWPFSKCEKMKRAFFRCVLECFIHYVFCSRMIDGLCIGSRDLCTERHGRARVFFLADLKWINSGKLYPFASRNKYFLPGASICCFKKVLYCGRVKFSVFVLARTQQKFSFWYIGKIDLLLLC